MAKRKIFLWLHLLFFSLTIGVSASWATKPRPPLQLSLLQTTLSKGQSRLILMATANIDASEVALSIDLPPELTLIEGEDAWKGTLPKGESQKIEIVVQGPDASPRQVVGKAEVHLPEGETFFQKSVLTLNKPKNKSAPPVPSLKRKEGGGSILEFKGR